MTLADRAIRAGYRINRFESLGSTNDEALRRARQGDRGNLWIVAARQTGGRGRQGRAWSSPPGNLYASLLLIDPAPAPLAPQLGFVAGIALARTIAACAAPRPPVAIKWPNDIVHEGSKLAGILVEGARCADGRFACVIGLGLNRASHPTDLPYAATDLFTVGAARPSLDDLMAALSANMAEGLEAWDRGRGYPAIRTQWLDHALPVGTRLSVAVGSTRAEGAFQSIDERGCLLMSTPDGVTAIDVGDVFLMDRPAKAVG